jgi:pimeloyl-ACP methyl ester carboxylesterase
LHGGFGNSNYWGHQVTALSGRHTVIVMDTRGHGRSPVTSDRFGFATFAEDVAALLALLRIPQAAIVGWSDGAITGLQLAMAKPQLVSRLFAFGANSTTAGLKPGGSKAPVFAAYVARCRAEYAQLSPDPGRWGALASGLGAMWRREPAFTPKMLADIRVPTVIADGAYDEIIRREDTALMARKIPGARLAILPQVSHFAMLQKPAAFNAALADFLAT